MDTNPSTLHDYFPRASGSNLLPVSPRRPHPPASSSSLLHAAASSTLTPRTEPYSTPFPVPSYLQHASLYKNRFATGIAPSSSSSPLQPARVGEPHRDSTKGKRPSYAATQQPGDNKEEDPILLPTAWNPDDKCALLDLTSDALGVSFAGSAKNGDRDAAAVRANRPVPSQAAVYYFEVKILDKGVSGYIGALRMRLPGGCMSEGASPARS